MQTGNVLLVLSVRPRCRGVLLGVVTTVLAGRQLEAGAPSSALTTLFLTPSVALAVGALLT